MSGGGDPESYSAKRLAAEARRVRDFDDLNNEMADRETGRQKRFLTSRDDAQSDGRGKDDKRGRAARNTFYLELIASGTLGSYIADEVFDAKSDHEITDIVARIEARTGRSFEDYAAEILGPEAAQRQTGESEADYQRRVLKSLTEEMIDPQTGRIKAQYADDPLAEIIAGDAAYERIMGDVSRLEHAGSKAEADALVERIVDDGYEAAALAGHHIAADGQKSDLRGGQQDHRDTELSDQASVERNSAFFGTPSAIEQASAAALDEFNRKSAETGPAGGPSISFEVSPGR